METEKERLPVELSGVVAHYKGNGRKLGYPTANIDTETDLKDGVYFGYSDLLHFQNHPTVIFIGTPTTLGDKGRRAEAHLLDIADIDYYGESIKMRAEYYYRQNHTFDTIEELLKIMKNDEAEARKWFATRQEASSHHKTKVGV